MNRRPLNLGAVVLWSFLPTAWAQDPLLTGPGWTLEGDEDYAELGWVVASAGDVDGDGFADVLIGAPGAGLVGRASLFLGSAEGLASTPAWSASGGQTNERFGASVACAGDVNADGYSDVIVGAPQYYNGDIEGRALVYLGSAGGLATTPVWQVEGTPVGFGESPYFGTSVASAGDVNGDGYADIVVGAPTYPDASLARGQAHVYLGSASGPSTTPAWVVEGDQNGTAGSVGPYLGNSVAAAGDVNGDGYDDLLVGADGHDNGHVDEGRAYLYLGSSSGLATSPAWTAEGNFTNVHFGLPVAGAGDIDSDGYADVVVSAYRASNGQVTEGRSYVYRGSSTGLSSNPARIVESNQAQGFQAYVSGAGDVNGDGYSDLVVGAGGFDAGQTDEGRVYLYLGSGSGLSTQAAWTFDSNQEYALLGTVAMAGDVNGDGYADVIVGAPYLDNGHVDEGRAYFFTGSAGALAMDAAWTTADYLAPDFSSVGGSLASAGDVNGDGFSDVLVGAPSVSDYSGGTADEGRAFLYLGSAGGPSSSPDWTAEGNQTNAHLGLVSSAGDVNGDGFDDVLVGAPDLMNGGLTGRALLYLGSSGGLATSPAWSADGDGAGGSVSSAGDVNADGFLDVLVGALYFSNGESFEGRALAYLGTPTGLATSPAWAVEGEASYAGLGSRVATAGDVNGDGFGDVAVASTTLVRVHLGSAGGLATSADWSTAAKEVATAGDVNGDGFSDLVVGDPLAGTGYAGEADLYLGSASGLSTSADWTDIGAVGYAAFGDSVASAGDVNSDGFSDVIVGSQGHNLGSPEQAFLYLGSAGGLALDPVWTGESDNQADPFTNYGASVAAAGDANGDGYGDVLVGAPAQDAPQDESGRAFLYLGNEGRGGWTLAPQQRRSNGSRPIALFGRSDVRWEFRIRLRFERQLAGLGWALPPGTSARLEWQVAPLGVALDSVALESGPAQPLTGAPLVFDESATFGSLSGSKPFHWRARVRTNHPFLPVTPWTWLPGNGVTEGKLRPGPALPTSPSVIGPAPMNPRRTRP